jgi:hypothetical protein
MDLIREICCRDPDEYVNSNEANCAHVHSAVSADEVPIHETHVGVEDQIGWIARADRCAEYIGGADSPYKVGDK